ncbi:hypothetical protein [Gorillibacterium sp. CAU 1737]|uniref:hypothetical protein n=1 Tax=Gorillibacterium sp. CAU 1737 TaxID=3140362 RepID=UPI0032610495
MREEEGLDLFIESVGVCSKDLPKIAEIFRMGEFEGNWGEVLEELVDSFEIDLEEEDYAALDEAMKGWPLPAEGFDNDL